MRRILNLLFIVIAFNSCAPRLSITPVSSPNNTGDNQGYLLALPRTVLMVTVDYSMTTHSSGPYAEFAEKYLGLSNVATDDSVAWRIDNIHITSRQEADPGKYYLAKFNCRFPMEMLRKLSSEGFIIDPLHSNYSPISPSGMQNGDGLTASFNDLSVKNFYYEKTDTLYKVVLRDSVFVRLPVLRNSIQPKHTEEKARETADLIIKIRNQRLNLLVPEDPEEIEKLPAEVLLKNLDLMEEKYLTLFTGISKTTKRSELFCVIPDMEKSTDTVSLKSKIMDTALIPLTIVFTRNTIADTISRNITPSEGVLYCRIPQRTKVEFYLPDLLLSQSYIYLYQSASSLFAIPLRNLQEFR